MRESNFERIGIPVGVGLLAVAVFVVWQLSSKSDTSYTYKHLGVTLVEGEKDVWRFEIRHLRSDDPARVIMSGGPYTSLKEARDAADAWLKESVG